MRFKLKRPEIGKKLLLSVLGTVTLFFGIFYYFYSRTLLYSYWDEVEWVGLSYYYQFFIEGDFSRDVWGKVEMAGDQPPLAKYAFGAWLYPGFIREKKEEKKEFDYTQYLITKGFNFIDTRSEIYPKNDNDWKFKSSVIEYADEGSRDYHIEKYGTGIVKTLDLIQKARELNVLLLTFNIFLIGYFFIKYKGLLFGSFFILFYGLNNLLLSAGPKAHAETLFIVLFNAGFISLFYYFLKRNSKFLLIFSVILGLSISTKLNGMMLYFTYLAMYVVVLPSGKSIARHLINLISPLIISLFVFMLLNPYVYTDPLGKTLEMYMYRRKLSYAQANMSFEPVFKNLGETVKGTFLNFYGKDKFDHYNNILINKTGIYLGPILLLLFITGLIDESIKSLKKNIFSLLFLITFLSTLFITWSYLNLNWDRYFVHLIVFFIYYQFCGFIIFVKYMFKNNKSIRLSS